MKSSSGTHVPRAVLLFAVMLAVAPAGCREGGPRPAAQEETMVRRPIAEVIAAHADSLMAVPGVVGVYEGRLDDGTPCLKIMVVRLDAALRARLPRTLEGHPVVVEETGEIREMPSGPEERKGAGS
jgi:hypothetical protein